MIKNLCCFFKFIIRFIFILFITVTLLLGGYTCILHKENGYIDDILIQWIETTNKQENIKINKIEESWSLNGLYLKTDVFEYKSENSIVKLKDIKLKIDLFNSLKDKTLKISDVSVNSLDVSLTENQEKESNTINNNESIVKEIIGYIHDKNINIDAISLNVENIKLKIENKKIDIDNIIFKKEKYSDLFYINYKDKVLTSFNYKINNKDEILSFFINVESNRLYLTKIISLLGQDEWLDFIYFDDIYTVIGDLESELVLNYDYKTNKVLSDYQAKIILNGNTIKLKSYEPITLTNAIGNLYYNDKKGFFSDSIIANLDRKKTKLKILQEDQEKDITFYFETKADLEKLSEISNFPLNKILKGSDSFNGFYRINFEGKDHLFVESSFENIDYDTNINLKKDLGFELNGFFDYENEQMNFDIKQGSNKILLNFIDGDFYNALIGINKKPINTKEKGLFINGFLEKEKLLNLIESMKEINNKFSENTNETNNGLNLDVFFEIDLKDTEFVDQNFENINVLYQNETLSLSFNEDSAEGYLYFNENTKTIDINLTKLKIKNTKATALIKENIKSNKSNIKSFDYSKILNENYKISINIDLLSLYDYPQMKLTTIGELGNGKLKLKDFNLKEINDGFLINGLYQYDSNSNISEIKKDGSQPLIVINNFDVIQKESGFQTEKITLDGFLNWNGFNLEDVGKSLNGNIDIYIEKGHIDKNNASVGFLKLLNLFNFDSWFKMFSFNFEEIDNGLHFNSIKGSFEIKDNKIKINPRIILDSDLFILEFTGQLDYIKNIYNIKVDAIVPLLNKAPAIALFAGVAPEIVGVIWLVDKLAGDVISETFTRSSFNISGDFENPIYTKNEL